MGGDETSVRKNGEREEKGFARDLIKLLYDNLVELDLNYVDLYDMTLYELIETLKNRRKGLAYKIWRLASFTRSPFVKEFPANPKEAMPELFIKDEGIAMPDFLVDKAIKRGVL